jgi:eukaryotic-like serine/threonine-protein kinase
MADPYSSRREDDALPDMIRRWRESTKDAHRAAWAEKLLQELVLLAEEQEITDLTALCADCPELLPELRSRVEKMRRVVNLFGMGADGGNRTIQAGLAPPPESRSIGRYELLVKVGEGGIGQVFKARHQVTGEIVAVKLLARNVAANPVTLKRFEQEFIASRKIDHPNVIRAIEHARWEDQPYLVMEYVEGESVGALIERARRLAEAEAVRLIAQVCEGLAQAHHRGMIHRDIKPDNILVTRQGVAKLADLGLVKDQNAMLNLTRTGRGLGTPHYMAPEQYDSAKTADVRSDVFALGATFYTMVTGEPPYGRHSAMADIYFKKVTNDFVPPCQLVPELSPQAEQVIHRALRADPNERPDSCREFVHLLVGSPQ